MRAQSATTTAVFMVSVILIMGGFAHAQEIGLEVQVVDGFGFPASGAVVSVWDVEGNQLDVTVTDLDGTANFSFSRPGTVSVAVRKTGFSAYFGWAELEAGASNSLEAKLRGESTGLAAILFPTSRVDLSGGTSCSIGEQDASGNSSFCCASFARDTVTLAIVAVNGQIFVQQSVTVSGPSCEMTKAGKVAYLGSAFGNWVRRYELVDGTWVPAGGQVALPGEGLRDLDLSPDGETLQAVQNNSIAVCTTGGAGLSCSRSVAIESPEQATTTPSGVGYATASDGCYAYSVTGSGPAVRIEELENARHLASIADRAALVALPDAWALYLVTQRLATLHGMTSRPGACDDAGWKDDGAGSIETDIAWCDGNAAKCGWSTWVLPEDDKAGTVSKAQTPADVIRGLEVHSSEIALRDFELTANLPAPHSLAANSAGVVLATFPFQNALVAFKADLGSGCQPSSTRACTLGDRFKLEVDWRDFQGNTGSGQVVPGGSEDSEIFSFFDADNWEMLVKTLDGCGVNGNYWVFSAATTDVEYSLRVTDTETGATREYTNPLGQSAEANVDTQAFPCAAGEKGRLARAMDNLSLAVSSSEVASLPGLACSDTDTSLCLNASRFQVEVEWRDFEDNRGSGQVVPLRSADSGLLWFFDADNWEMLVKVLDGCGVNGSFWVFAAATTNVEYTLRVTDTVSGQMREYHNALGQAAPALTDTNAFSCSP